MIKQKKLEAEVCCTDAIRQFCIRNSNCMQTSEVKSTEFYIKSMVFPTLFLLVQSEAPPDEIKTILQIKKWDKLQHENQQNYLTKERTFEACIRSGSPEGLVQILV